MTNSARRRMFFRPYGEVAVPGYGLASGDAYPFEVEGGTRFGSDGLGTPLAAYESVADVALPSVRRVLERARANGYAPILSMTSDSPDEIEEDYSPRLETGLVLHDGALILEVTTFLEDPPEEQDLTAALLPFLASRKTKVISLDLDGTPRFAQVTLQLEPQVRGRVVRDLVQLGDEIVAYAKALKGGAITRQTMLALVEGGRPNLLVGVEENDWFEAKSQGYDLSSTAACIELASDIARFANANTGGLIIIGLHTKRRAGVDTVSGVATELDPATLSPRRYRKRIDQYLYPLVEGLKITPASYTHGPLLAIEIPSQPEDLKPFLVHGAIVDDHIEGSFISIIRRRGEDSVPVAPAAIHALLVAGRARSYRRSNREDRAAH